MSTKFAECSDADLGQNSLLAALGWMTNSEVKAVKASAAAEISTEGKF